MKNYIMKNLVSSTTDDMTCTVPSSQLLYYVLHMTISQFYLPIYDDDILPEAAAISINSNKITCIIFI